MTSQPPDGVPFLDLATTHNELLPDLEAAWNQVVGETAFIGGEHAARFEESWAAFCGVEHTIGVANGTDAIELVLRALGIGPGDEVIIPANTFIATAEAVVACGATPIFVDVDPDTLLATADHFAAAISPRTAALLPVHLYGQPCEMDAIDHLATTNGLAVIEDAAQAHGAAWRGRPAGSLGTAASFSFYPGKNLGAFGDAGAVVTDDAQLAATVRSLANHGRADGEHVVHPLLGRNSRLDGVQAAVLSIKLPFLEKWNGARRAARERYVERLRNPLVVPVKEHPEAVGVWHLNVVQVPDRDLVMERMRSAEIDVRIHYPQPCHLHAAFSDQPTLPVVEAAAERLLSLPMYPTIGDHEIERVCDALDDALAGTTAPRTS